MERTGRGKEEQGYITDRYEGEMTDSKRSQWILKKGKRFIASGGSLASLPPA
jgi:hypothetical protein